MDDIREILKYLPHRYPFLMVDRVTGFEPNQSLTAIKNVTFNEPQFQGHFPETPIFPGVMIVEALAQTAAVLVGVGQDLADKEFLVYFMGIDGAKFRRKVVPGDTLKLHVETKRGGGKVWKFSGRAEVDGELACECEFTAMMDAPKG